MDVVSPKGGEMQNSGPLATSTPETEYISRLLQVFDKAETMDCLNEDLASQNITCYLQMGKFDEAMKLAEKFCEDRFSNAKQLWVLRVTEQMKHIANSAGPSKGDLSSTFDLLKQMVKKVAASDVESLWVMVCNHLYLCISLDYECCLWNGN